MYREFFQLQDNPFGVTPDPDYLYLSASHQEAYDHLLYGVRERKGFIEVIGAPGTGKTMLCRLFLDRMDDRGTRTAYVFNTFLSDIELLQAITEEFGLRPRGQGRKALLDSLSHFLIDVAAEGGNAVLLIDEAQNLSEEALEQLRMLSNLETATDKLLQVVLVGGPELHARLARSRLQPLNDRVAVRHRLAPLSREETEAYIMHRLRVAGWRGLPQVEAGVAEAVWGCSGGVPRRINTVCDRALLVAFVRGSRRLERADVERAHSELETLDEAPQAVSPAGAGAAVLDRLRRPWAAAALLAVVLGAGGWAWSRTRVEVAESRPVSQVVKAEASMAPVMDLRLDAKAASQEAPQATVAAENPEPQAGSK